MNKQLIVLVLILLAFSCQHDTDSKITRNDFKGKTFSLIYEPKKDTTIISFTDSSHQVLISERWKLDLPWRIAQYQNSTFLVLEDRVAGINKIDTNNFDIFYIGEIDQSFILSERESKWNKEQIYGTWIQDIYVGRGTINFPHPPSPDGLKVNWPPSYTISEDKIVYDYLNTTESEIEITNNAEFIVVDFGNSNSFNSKKILWKIKSLSDSVMVVDRDIIAKYSSSESVLDGFQNGRIKLVRYTK